MKSKISSKTCALFLALTMLFGFLPISAFSLEDAHAHIHTDLTSDEAPDVKTNAPSELWDGSEADGFDGGTGTENDPYLIRTAAQLAYFRTSVNDGNRYSEKYIKLTADIDLGSNEWVPIGIGSATGTEEIASGTVFSGTFDGDFHTVSNLYVNTSSRMKVGFFGALYGATVKNLGIADASVTMTYNDSCSYGGILSGYAKKSKISLCFVTGDLDVTNTRTSPSHNATAGMLVGSAAYVTVSDCYASGACTALSTAKGYNTYAGGLIGLASDLITVTGSYFSGNITGESISNKGYVGGIIGACSGTGDSSLVKDCFCRGSFDSSYYVSDIYSSFSNKSYVTALNNYVDISCSGHSVSTSVTTVNVDSAVFESSESVISKLGWNFDTVWTFASNSSYKYPVLQGFYVKTEAPAECDHDWSAATCLAPKTCTKCGATVGDAADHADADSDGLCDVCGATLEKKKTGKVLIIQNGDPWSNDTHQSVMSYLLSKGYITGYDIVSTFTFDFIDISDYSVIQLVTDNNQTDVASANKTYDRLLAFANSGGCVIYNCAWQSDYSDNFKLPLGVKCRFNGSTLNKIANSDHPIVSGSLTGGNSGIIGSFNGNSASHTYIERDSLPDNSNIIFTDDSGNPTLAEYRCGSGNIIVTGQTWTYYYNDSGVSPNFSKIFYDDLYVYALSTAFGGATGEHVHSFTAGETFAPSCTEDGYTVYSCRCGESYKGDTVPRYGHSVSEWIIICPATCTESGLKRSYCERCECELENVYIKATGHHYVSELTRAATCTEPGIITHTCQNCNDSYVTYVYSEHSYSLAEHISPSCEADGKNIYKCERCDSSYEEMIPGGHDYSAKVTKPATEDEDGELTYTCSLCGDTYTEAIPKRPDASILLIQDKLAWQENSNADMLNSLVERGLITSWDISTTGDLNISEIMKYSIILIANDQPQSTYSALASLNADLENFVYSGGVIIYGACDSGWAGGKINYTLPGGVSKHNNYSERNYIVNSTHNIITGALTDGTKLTDSLLFGNYCSHSYFTDLPNDAVTILSDASGRATLVEYPLGAGYVIAGGLTWEFAYTRNLSGGTSYAKVAYDDLILHAATLASKCDHVFDSGVTVEPTCKEGGYILHTCESCGCTVKDNFTEKLKHTPGEWSIVKDATELAEGLRELRCTECDGVLMSEVIPMLGAPITKIESEGNITVGASTEFTFTVDSASSVKYIEIILNFDSSIFELVDIEWLIDGAAVSFDIKANKATASWESPAPLSGAILKFVLKARSECDSSSVGAGITISDGSSSVSLTAVPKNSEIAACRHGAFNVVESDGDLHILECTACGHREAARHEFTEENTADKFLAENATCTAAAKYYYSCKCGAHCDETFEHGEKPNGTHSWGEWTTVIGPTFIKSGLKEHVCDKCGESEQEIIGKRELISPLDMICAVGDTVIGYKGSTKLIITAIGIMMPRA